MAFLSRFYQQLPHRGSSDRNLSPSSYTASLMCKKESLQQPHILRVTHVSRILRNFGAVFKLPEAATWHFQKSTNQDHSDAEHSAADNEFFTSQQSTEIDVFISHVWAASRMEKYLAVLYYVNIRWATCIAVFVWLATATVLIISSGDVVSFGGRAELHAWLVMFPILWFYLVFFLGHHIPGRKQARFWLDKLSIHQTNIDLKVLGVSALPEFVSLSKRLLILWNSSYFERLWCNVEVATFCSVRGDAQSVDFQPLWLAPWVLTTIAFDVLAVLIVGALAEIIPALGEFFASVFGPGHRAIFFSQLFGIGLCMGSSYLPAAYPISLSMISKFDDHDQMMAQIFGYDLDNAKCTVETDRSICVQQIETLFRENRKLGCDPSNADIHPLKRFNNFMRRDFRHSCISRIGTADRLPYHLALLVFLPLNFEALANVLTCDEAPCDEFARNEGYSSVAAGMLTNATNWLFGVFLIYPTTYPMALFLMGKARRRFTGVRQKLVSFACIITAYFYMGFAEGLTGGIIVNVVTSDSSFWRLALVIHVCGFGALNYHLFLRQSL